MISFDKTISTTLLNINSSILSVNSLPLLSFEESYQLLKQYVEDLPAASNSKVKRWIENAQGIPIQLLAYDQESDLVVSSYATFSVKLWGSLVVAFSVILALSIHAYNLGYLSPEEASSKPSPEEVVKPWNQAPRLNEEEVTPYPVTQTSKPEIVAVDTASPEDIFAIMVAEPETAADESSEIKTPLAEDIEVNLETPAQSDNVQIQTMPEPALEEVVSQREQSSADELDEAKTNSDQINVNQSQSLYKIDNSAFFSLPSDQFVLQLTAVSTQDTLVKYLESVNLDLSQVRVYQIARNGKDWIVVTYGVFPTIAAARAEAAKVEPKAWAKSVAVIQQQITSYQRSSVN